MILKKLYLCNVFRTHFLYLLRNFSIPTDDKAHNELYESFVLIQYPTHKADRIQYNLLHHQGRKLKLTLPLPNLIYTILRNGICQTYSRPLAYQSYRYLASQTSVLLYIKVAIDWNNVPRGGEREREGGR